jgi:hypothetical protein
MTENGRLGFEGSLRNLLNLGVNDECLDSLIEMLPEHLDYSKRNIPSATKDTMARVRGTRVGYYTFRFNQMFGNADDVFFCQLETLSEDLVAFFERIGAGTDEIRDYVQGSPKVNATEHSHYSRYYTDELADLVSVRDRQLIQRFGYAFRQGYSLKKDDKILPYKNPDRGV